MTLRQAALTAGFAYLLNPVSYAEFSIYPELVIPGHIEVTVQNLATHPTLFLGAVCCYFISFIGDIVLAWALYILLAPVHRALSLLAAWFQLVYAAVALVGVTNLMSVHHLSTSADLMTAFGPAPLNAQIMLALQTFRHDWELGLVLFGFHLVLIGCLAYRSGFIPKVLGALLAVNGLGWVLDSVGPYLFPSADLGYVSITFFSEVLFMVWLLARGWKIPEPTALRPLRSR